MSLSDSVSIPQALLYSLVGFLIVFVALVLLMVVINIMAALMKRGKKSEAAVAAGPVASAAAAPTASASGMVPAPGSLGEIMLNGVSEKTAAMAMAIIADELKTPLNELRFISIKKLANIN